MSEPGGPGAPAPVRFRATGRAMAGTIAGAVIAALGCLLIGLGLARGVTPMLWGGITFAGFGALGVSTLRQSATLDGTTLYVRGRFSSLRCDVGHLRGLGTDVVQVAWVDVAGTRPFRVYFLGPHRGAFLAEVQARATRAGAAFAPAGDTPTKPPRGTRPFFSL